MDYGSPLTLSCAASGIDITWVWYHNGLELAESTSTLTLEDTVEEESGLYQCFAYNPAGFEYSVTQVLVNRKWKRTRARGQSDCQCFCSLTVCLSMLL